MDKKRTLYYKTLWLEISQTGTRRKINVAVIQLLAMKYCPPPRQKSTKMKGKQHSNYSQSEEVTTAIEKNPSKDPPAIVFFLQRKYLDSIREHSELLSR
jgi:hypothetical protein